MAEETDIFRNGGIDDITRVIVDQSKITGSDVNVIVKGTRFETKISKRESPLCSFLDPLAHTIPAAFYRNMNHDLIIEYVPTKLGLSSLFEFAIRT